MLAVAAPVGGEEIALTNRAWTFRLGEIADQFGWSALRAINDFEAVAWALPGLRAEDVRAIGPVRASGSGVQVVCGPGTGLGVAALIPDNGFWRVVASEGGHMSFGAAEPDEEAVFRRLREMSGAGSAEAILSGPGLARLHRAVHPDAEALSPEEIIARAKSGDAAARATATLFVRLLGRFAGDVALAFKATGAVYLTGGVGCGLGTLLDAPEFRRAFEAHAPYQRLLATIPDLPDHRGRAGPARLRRLCGPHACAARAERRRVRLSQPELGEGVPVVARRTRRRSSRTPRA